MLALHHGSEVLRARAGGEELAIALVLALYPGDERRMAEHEHAGEQDEERGGLERAPGLGGAQLVTEERDADQDTGKGVDQDQRRLRCGDRTRVEGVLRQEHRED